MPFIKMMLSPSSLSASSMLTSTPPVAGQKPLVALQHRFQLGESLQAFQERAGDGEHVERMSVGGDGGNLPVRHAHGLARHADFDLRFGFLHQPNCAGEHVLQLAGLIRLDQIVERMNRKGIERIFSGRG